MDIEDWRRQIDEIDMDLLRLLNRRAQIAITVGSLKRAAGMPLCDARREEEILRRISEANAGPLRECVVNELFRHVISVSRHAERLSCEESPTVREAAL